MQLHSLLLAWQPDFDLTNVPEIEILGVQEDSRLVRTGDLFIARRGTQADGTRFIADAHARGAVAVVVPQRMPDCPIPQVIIPDPSAASVLANLYHDSPSHSLKVLGITGTNGKTTTTYLLRHILRKNKLPCGLIGTVEIDDGKESSPSEMTTPGPVILAGLLADMVRKGAVACAMETSSHALHQGRVAGIRYTAAGFTNLTGDHLDYHGTMDAYAAAKALLFESLDERAVAVVNADDPWHRRIARDCRAPVSTFGIASGADYRAVDGSSTASGSRFILVGPDGRTEVEMGLPGRHNIENALCATAIACETFGLTLYQAATALRDATGAPGRLQPVHCGQNFTVLVDYAHTDDALRNVLSALRPICKGKLRLVFGCGGDRDRTKRPRMGLAAAELADVIYVTSDNPRTENPSSIIDEIISGIPADSGKPVVVEPDRRAAIERAILDAKPRDVVLIAGKGHENYQIVGTTRRHFDDVEEARRVLSGGVRA